MMGKWDLPSQGSLLDPDSLFKEQQVLVEYDGPQIVTGCDFGGRYLALAADEGDYQGLTRWIYASITDSEYRALAEGALTVRDAMHKPRVLVIDVEEGRPARIWECDAAQIGEANLPDPGVYLPAATRWWLMDQLGMTEPETPEVRLESSAGGTQAVPFRSLSEVLSSAQRLWTALAQATSGASTKARGRWSAELSERATVALAAAAPGSLVLRLEPTDAEVFDRASGAFEELVRAGDDREELAKVLGRLGPRVRARYQELGKYLERHRLQFFERRRGGAAFLSPLIASRAIAALPQRAAVESETIPVVGYFVACDVASAKFEFYDDESDTKYAGKLGQRVLEENDVIAVGPGARYAVFIEVSVGRDGNVLVGLRETALIREGDDGGGAEGV